MQSEAEALAAAASIRDTMQTDGWRLVSAILREQVEGLDTIRGIASLKDLQARQVAHRALTNFLNDLEAIKGAETSFVAEKQVRKLQDPIFRVVQ